MNDQSNKHDEQWLEALAGRPDAQADKDLNREAGALRRALEVNRQLLEAEVPAVDEAHLQQLMFRLRREGLTGQEIASTVKTRWQTALSRSVAFSRSDQLVESSPRPLGQSNTRRLWQPIALAASVVLVIGFLVQQQLAGVREDALAKYRGPEVITISHAQPEARLIELQTGLRLAGEVAIVEHLKDGQIGLKVNASQAVFDFLATQRIEPTPKNGWIYLKISPVKSSDASK